MMFTALDYQNIYVSISGKFKLANQAHIQNLEKYIRTHLRTYVRTYVRKPERHGRLPEDAYLVQNDVYLLIRSKLSTAPKFGARRHGSKRVK